MKKYTAVLLLIVLITAACSNQQAAVNTETEEVINDTDYVFDAKQYVKDFKFTLSGNNTTITYPLTDIENIRETYLSSGDAWQWQYEYIDTTDPDRIYYIILTQKGRQMYLDLVAHYDNYDDEQFYIVKDTDFGNIDNIPANDPVCHAFEINNKELKGTRKITTKTYSDHYEIKYANFYAGVEDGYYTTDEYGNANLKENEENAVSDDNVADVTKTAYTLCINKEGVLTHIRINSAFYKDPLYLEYIEGDVPITIAETKREEIDLSTLEQYISECLIRKD